MTEVKFESFQKIPRLKRTCWITEKIDGTNAQVYITNTGEMHVGSRNRWITPEQDNHGFARWCQENKEELLKLGPGRHFGEWWGAGIQRRYGLNVKRFSLFNADRWKDAHQRPECCDVVPVLYVGEFTTEAVDQCLLDLKTNGSKAVAGFMNPEGVVVYLTAAGTYHKVTLDGDGPKGT